ncbi:oxygen-independent coproporphyrinogen III oxidase [Helicobacter cetorum]|uniref:oxygen-independent coproporphyrinogen III oxidase n=1 Tax=Helicobacter cetorum TaxID=138563 RepID=UPI000CF17524|nr:oxygen-independent coproporphyrinogen III oxidase [Helicobacter cetorum]
MQAIETTQNIDFEKFSKYSKPGPRYTSYPTAVEFKEGFNEESLKTAFFCHDNLKNPMPLSLYTHLPFCRSACYFCACSVIYTSLEDKKTRYISYLKKELSLLKNAMNTNREVAQFHYGGGTPTFFSPTQLDEITQSIQEVFPNFSKDIEMSCEIDPRHFTKEHMQTLSQKGFNRLSFGVQDFEFEVQKAIHRIQPFDMVQNAVKLARDYGIKSINFDLIYGLPNQTKESFLKTLELVLELNPDRLAVFNYAHVPWVKKTMRKIDETLLPSPKTKLEILEALIRFLENANYKMIGMDHFAKSDNELYKSLQKSELRRNFQGYTTKKFTQTIGIGLTSIGEGGDYYTQNYKDMQAYENALDLGHLPVERGVALTKEDVLRKEVIMQMMSNLKLDYSKIEEKFHIDFRTHFEKELEKLKPYEEVGLLCFDSKGFEMTRTGSMLVRNIAMEFDAYLRGGEKQFSKTL